MTTRTSAPAVEQSGSGIQEGGPVRRRADRRDHGVEVAGLVQPQLQPVEQPAAAAGPVGGIGDEHADVERAAWPSGRASRSRRARDEDGTEDDRSEALPCIRPASW